MENEELPPLKALYDELWRDAETMIKDMNRSITTVFLCGITMLAIAPIELGTVVDMYSKVTAGSARWLDYLYLVAGAIGMVLTMVCGIGMLKWHSALKTRYAKLIELEKTLGE